MFSSRRQNLGLWKKKDIHELHRQSQENSHQLVRALGAHHLIMLGIGAIIGAGLFSITGIAAANHAGPAILLSFIIAAIGCAFCGLCYSELAAMVPVSGSAYTYTYATMGQFCAWFIGWNLILEYAIGAATVSISWSAYVVSFLHSINIYPPEHLIASPWQPVTMPDGSLSYGMINLPAILIVIAISLLLLFGIRQSARFNAAIVCIKVAIVVVFIIAGASYIKMENFVPFIPENQGTWGEFGISGIFRAAGIVFFAYIGFDAVSTAAQEAKNPQRTMPIGIIGSLIICTILYIAFAFVLVGLVPYRMLNVAAPIAIAIDQTPFWWLGACVKLAIIAGFTSVILVLLLGQSRIFLSMAQDGLLPKYFSDIHPVYRTPWKSQLFLMTFICLFSGFAPLSVVGELTSIGTLFAFVLVCISVMILRVTHPEFPRPFAIPGHPWVPLCGIAVCLVLMFSLGIDTWFRLLVWSLIGFAIYFFYSRPHSKKIVP